MNKIKRLLLLLPFSGLFISCEKVIHLNLDTAEKKYVIEAIITDQPATAQVLISQTKNFEEDNNFPGISGAVVTITEVGGAVTTLTETAPGKYTNPALTGISGRTYTLSVNIGGQVFTAVSAMPQKINLDTIFVTDELLFTETQKIANAVYQDPPGRGNNYRFIQYINGKKGKQVIVNNDDYTDGRTVFNKLFYFADEDIDKIQSGDNLSIDLLCINADIYRYWFSLSRSATGVSGQATPSNPVTNLKGDALGYFSAHTLQTKTMLVP